jgi:hypothetical protein
MTGSLHDISVAIGGLQEGVKALGRSLDQMRAGNENDFREIRASIDTLKQAHHQRVGSRRTLSMLWGGAGGGLGALITLIATKIGLK